MQFLSRESTNGREAESVPLTPRIEIYSSPGVLVGSLFATASLRFCVDTVVRGSPTIAACRMTQDVVLKIME